MADIVRLFQQDPGDSAYAWDVEGQMFDITDMFVFDGQEMVETDDLDEAERVVIKLGEHNWLGMDVSDKTPWAESVN
jgi:hypothetical protein